MVALGFALAGCGGRVASVSGYRLSSIESRGVLAPSLKHAWFTAPDENTADIYLTDLPEQTLTSAEALATASGNLVHIRMLLRPKAGSTPIEPTALTAAIVHVVLAGGEVGVYHGGGFMWPAGSTSDRTFGGSIDGGTMSLGNATPGFEDRLGPCRMNAGFRAARDEDRVREFRAALAWALAKAPAVERGVPAGAAAGGGAGEP